MNSLVGQCLGNYHLTQVLGQGAFAEVYLGIHQYLETPSAIKVLHMQMDASTHEYFRREAWTIAHLQHSNIVRVLDFGVQNQTPYLVMEYLPNGTLRTLHPKGTRLPLEKIVDYVKQIALALDYAHQRGVIHRDIKPENMLLNARHEVVLSDFGIAIVQKTLGSLSTQSPAGTPQYMAPEQIRGKPCAASDQYALGVIVYEWLCGEPPFHGPLFEVYSQHLYEQPPGLCARLPQLPQAVEDTVFGALAKNPLQRFANILDFASVLEEACQATQSLSSPVPFAYTLQSESTAPIAAVQGLYTTPPVLVAQQQTDEVQTQIPFSQGYNVHYAGMDEVQRNRQDPATNAPIRKGVSRRAMLLGLTGLVAVASGGMSMLAFAHELPFTRPAATLVPPALTTVYPPGVRYIYRHHTLDAYMAVWSPNGSRVASCGADRTVQVWDAMTGEHPLIYREHTDEVNGVAWWSEGGLIASASRDKTVRIWGAITGTTTIIYRGHSGVVTSVAWAPTGSRIASAAYDKTVQVWDSITEERTASFTQHTDWVLAEAWSPDGRLIASAGRDKTVQIWEAATGNHVLTYQGHGSSVGAVAWSGDGRYIASGSDQDGQVHVWDATNGERLFVYQGHTDGIWTVAWSNDSRRVASGGKDKTVQIWDALTGKNVFTYTHHTATIWTALWSPDGQNIASASADKTIQVWQAT